jgi:hypothetical protein
MITDYEMATRYCCGELMEYAGETTIIREEARWTATTALPNATQETQDKMVCRVCGRIAWVTRG